METITKYSRLLIRALFLHDDAYRELRAARRPFLTGLLLILLVSILFSLAAFVGDTLESMTRPEPGLTEEALWRGMEGMAWFQESAADEAETPEGLRQQMAFGWKVARLLSPGPLRSALVLLINSLLLLIGWLLYGLWAAILANTLGGKATLGQTYGSLALAVSPHLLRTITLIPFATAGSVVLLWSLVCSYLAVKIAHDLTPARAFGATLLSLLSLVLSLLVLLVVLIVVIMGLVSLGGGQSP